MVDVAQNRRRWFQFGLGTMFVVVTVCAPFLTYHANWIRQRHKALDQSKPYRLAPGAPPFVLKLLGETGYSEMGFARTGNDDPNISIEVHQAENLRKLFPEVNRIDFVTPQ